MDDEIPDVGDFIIHKSRFDCDRQRIQGRRDAIYPCCMPAAPAPLRRRPARQRLGLLLAVGLAATSLAACSTENQSADDAYKIGCPALDAAAAGGSTLNQAAVKALETARDSGQLDPEPTKWVQAAIGVLASSDASDIPADAKKLLIDGCAEHGYTLQNLK